MIDAIVRAVAQLLTDRAIWKIVLLSVLLAIAVFAAVWVGVWFLLTRTSIFDIAWLETAIDVLGGLATLLLTWLLFPAVVSATVCIFLESAANAVEKQHYADLPEAKGIGFFAGLVVSIRFLVVLVILNVLLLFFLIVPPLFPIMFYLVNGYLIGREYFELVALRRWDARRAAALRKKRSAGVVVFGIAVAFLLTVPVANLLAPIVATAAMVHLFESWRKAEPDVAAAAPLSG